MLFSLSFKRSDRGREREKSCWSIECDTLCRYYRYVANVHKIILMKLSCIIIRFWCSMWAHVLNQGECMENRFTIYSHRICEMIHIDFIIRLGICLLRIFHYMAWYFYFDVKVTIRWSQVESFNYATRTHKPMKYLAYTHSRWIFIIDDLIRSWCKQHPSPHKRHTK